MQKEPQKFSVTSLATAPEVERKRRILTYVAAMLVRTVCVILMVVTKGWWVLVFGAGAIFLPYFAVVLANSASPEEIQHQKPNQFELDSKNE